MSDRDLFGDRAEEYARLRPTYPPALFQHLESLAPGHDLVESGMGAKSRHRSGVSREDLYERTTEGCSP